MVATVAAVQIKDLQKRLALVEHRQRRLQLMATGGAVPVGRKARDQTYYDDDYVVTGENEVKFFESRVYAQGPKAGTTKTKAEQNQLTEGSFPAPHVYTILGLKCNVLHDLVSGARPGEGDLELLRMFSIVRYFQGSRPIWEFPLSQFSAPGFVGQGNATAAGGFVNFGPPGLSDFYRFDVGFVVEAGQSFAFEVVTSPEFVIDAPIRIRLAILGQLITTQR